MKNDHPAVLKSRWQDVVKSLLALSVETSPLDVRLEKAVDIIVKVSWLPLEPQGALFLFEPQSNALRLTVSTGLAKPVLQSCRTVELGYCLCGRAAQTGEVIHASKVDDCHDVHYLDMQPHGHYVVPIKNGGQLLGVLTLYLSDGHLRDEEEIEALEIFCSIIASMIVRARAEEELHRTRLKAEIATQAKSQFLSNMSHEIRTPLTAIIGYAEALQQHLTLDEFKHCIQAVKGCSNHLLDIVNSVLDFAKIEAGKLELDYQRVNFTTLAEELVRTYEKPAQQKGLSIRAEIDPAIPSIIVTDLVRTKQIIVNLMSNAIKFTHAGEVVLAAQYLNDSDRIIIELRDTGIGMGPEELEALFQAFSQVDKSISRRFGGTGLGLHIANQLAAKLGSEISVQSESGVGSRFFFELNCNSPMSKSVGAVSDDIDSLTSSNEPQRFSGKVLIGEDGQDVRDLLSFLLRHSGLALEFAFDGAQALELAQQNHYDLLILDIQMPQLCGVEVVRSLRENGHTGPIIALTANAYQQEVDVYFQSGFDHVLAKPFQAQQLFKLIGLYCPAEPMENREFSSIENELTMEEVIAGFVSSLPQRLDRIRQCRSCNGMAGLRNEVHNLCVAGLFGFSKIEAAARTLQSKIDSGDENIGDLAGQLEFLLEQAYNDQAGPR